MPEPTGENTFRGLALPAYGEWEQVQRNSSATMITLTHSTANTGLLMAGRNSVSSQFWGPGSSAQGGLVFAITAAGGFSVRSGTTVLMELNSSGLYSRSVLLAGVSGARNTISPTTGAIFAVTSTMGGSIFNIGQNATSQLFTLPINPPAGFWIEVYVPISTVVDHFQIVTTGDSSAKIYLPGLSSAFSTADNIQPGSTLAHAVRMTALSSIIWFAEPIGQFQFGESTVVAAQAAYGWTTGTTA